MAEPARSKIIRLPENRFVKNKNKLRNRFLGEEDIRGVYQDRLERNDPRLHHILADRLVHTQVPERVIKILKLAVSDKEKVLAIRNEILNSLEIRTFFSTKLYTPEESNQLLTYYSSILFNALKKQGKITEMPKFWREYLRNLVNPTKSNVQPKPNVVPFKPESTRGTTKPGATTKEPGLDQGRQQVVDTLKAREEALRQQERERIGDKVYNPVYERPAQPKARISLSEEEIRRRNMEAKPMFDEPVANAKPNLAVRRPGRTVGEIRSTFARELEQLEGEDAIDPETRKTLLDNVDELAKDEGVDALKDYVDGVFGELALRRPNRGVVVKVLPPVSRTSGPAQRKALSFNQLSPAEQVKAIAIDRRPALPNIQPVKRSNEVYRESVPQYPEQRNFPVGEHQQIVKYNPLVQPDNLTPGRQRLVDTLDARRSNLDATNQGRQRLVTTLDARRQALEKREFLLKKYTDYLDVNYRLSPERRTQLQDILVKHIDVRGVDAVEKILHKLIPDRFWAKDLVYDPKFEQPSKLKPRRILLEEDIKRRNMKAEPMFDRRDLTRPIKVVDKDITSFSRKYIEKLNIEGKTADAKIVKDYSQLLDLAVKYKIDSLDEAKFKITDLVEELSSSNRNVDKIKDLFSVLKELIASKIGFTKLENTLISTIDELIGLNKLTKVEQEKLIGAFNRLKNEFDITRATTLVEQYVNALEKSKINDLNLEYKTAPKSLGLSKEQLIRANVVRTSFEKEFRKRNVPEAEIKRMINEYLDLLKNKLDGEEYLVGRLQKLANASEQKNNERKTYPNHAVSKSIVGDISVKPNSTTKFLNGSVFLSVRAIRDIITKQLAELRESKKGKEIVFLNSEEENKLRATYANYLESAIAEGVVNPEMQTRLQGSFNRLLATRDVAKVADMLDRVVKGLPERAKETKEVKSRAVYTSIVNTKLLANKLESTRQKINILNVKTAQDLLKRLNLDELERDIDKIKDAIIEYVNDFKQGEIDYVEKQLLDAEDLLAELKRFKENAQKFSPEDTQELLFWIKSDEDSINLDAYITHVVTKSKLPPIPLFFDKLGGNAADWITLNNYANRKGINGKQRVNFLLDLQKKDSQSLRKFIDLIAKK